MTITGLGDNNAFFNVYIGNRPAFIFDTTADEFYPLKEREIYAIGQACGNGWRKVFNVYAKLIYAFTSGKVCDRRYESWQQYRDHALLQQSSGTALRFDAPQFNAPQLAHSKTLHLIMGRTYASKLVLPHPLVWLTEEFALDRSSRLIVCPYFDYRQLSNQKIIFLVDLLRQEFGNIF